MADVLIAKIQFIDTNPYGTYVAGDELKIYYDSTGIDPAVFTTVHAGISVYLNGVEVFTGADLRLGAQERPYIVFTEQEVVEGLCVSTYWTEFPRLYMSFPWYVPFYYADHPSCAINPPSCDLILVGVPQVTTASGPTTADGEIIVTASSSQTIQYKLNSDFSYGDGSGHQSTGTFSSLTPGQYRIYVRDALNCGANVLVTVGFSNTYGPLYRLEFDDPVGGVTKIDISQRDYAGSVTEVKGADIPFERSLKGEASLDKFESILATKATVNLTSETNFAFAGLYTNSPEEFRIEYYKDAVLKGVYKVLPQQYSEDYSAPPYYVSVVATDGLPGLKDYVFLQDDGQRFHGDMKAIELIAFILKKTKLQLSIRVGINMYATGMTTTAASDPLDQAYVDCDTYYINEAEPTLDYVLRQILEPFGARIVQENAVWNIVRIEELKASYDYREFDYEGTYVSNSSYDPRLSVSPVGTAGLHFSDRDHHLTLCPGYGKIRVFYRLGLRENILENGNFRLTSIYDASTNQYFFGLDTYGFQLVTPGYPLTQSWEDIGEGNVAWKIEGGIPVSTTGESYIQSDTYNIKMGVANTLKISIRYKLPPPVAYGLTPIPIDIPYQKVRIRIKYGTNYLLSDGTWSTDENFLIIYATEFDKYLETDFTATQPDAAAVDGYNFDVRIYHSYIYHAEYSSFADLRLKDTYDEGDAEAILPLGTRSEVSTFGALESMYYYELEESTDAESEPSIIRPADYHATNNPVQWILHTTIVKTYFTNFTSPFWIDHVKVAFLTSGSASVDTILREINAEPKNTAVLEKEVTHGSYQSLITTIPQWDFGIGKLTASSGATLSLLTTNILAADILYAGYFRSSAGAGYSTWTRDGISEEASLHSILLQQYAAQYKRSWRKLTGSFYSQSSYFNFLNVLKIVSDSNRLYLPISPTIDDKNNRVRGEFLELIDITSGAGSDGSSGSPFTSGFTTGFGGGYN